MHEQELDFSMKLNFLFFFSTTTNEESERLVGSVKNKPHSIMQFFSDLMYTYPAGTSMLNVNFEAIEFGDVIGRGTFATVHKGEVNGAVVALKCIRILAGGNLQQLVIDSNEIAALKYIL